MKRITLKLISLIGLASVLVGSSPVIPATQPETLSYCSVNLKGGQRDFHRVIIPLADIIARGEGTWDSVNRGYAGDTPGGIVRLTGRSFSQMTVNEVIQLQRWQIFAVGRYQFIPSTLRFAVRHSDVKGTDLFTPETQNKLFAVLLEHKRPRIAAYIRGQYHNLNVVLNDLAKEWASIEYRWGRSYYGYGGNRAHVSRAEVSRVIQAARAAYAK